MELYKIALRALFAYAFILILMRLSGKRTVAQATPFDFVLALILGDMFDDCFWAEVPVSQFVVGAGFLVTTHLLVSMGSFANKTFDRLVGGSPVMFMRDGTMLKRALRREQMNEKEAAALLRLKGLGQEQWEEVKSATIEVDSQLGVLKHEWARPAQKRDREQLRGEKR